MTTNCKNCGKKIEGSVAFCTYCGAENNFNGSISASVVKRKKKHHILFVLLYILGAFAAIVALVAVLNANLLLPWQRGARINKQVILEYAAEHYPNAEIVDQEFNSAHFFVWNNFRDCIVFNWDDVEFGITAKSGSILVDGYCGARAIAQFDRIIQDGFLKPRGIKANTDYSFVDNYEESYPYTGGLSVQIAVFDQGSTPQEVGWLYNFYKYWKKEGEFLRLYAVEIDIIENKQRMCHINFLNDDDFPDEEKFYSAFKAG